MLRSHHVIFTVILRGQHGDVLLGELFMCLDGELCVSIVTLSTPKLIWCNQVQCSCGTSRSSLKIPSRYEFIFKNMNAFSKLESSNYVTITPWDECTFKQGKASSFI